MESFLGELNSRGSSLHTEPSLRLKTRPKQSGSSKGKAFEDLGSSFGTPWSSSQDKSRSANRPKQIGKRADGGKNITGKHTRSILDDDAMDSESEDELNTLSRHDASDSDSRPRPPRTKTKDDEVFVDGQNHKYHPDFLPDTTLSKLKFKKIKKTDGEATNGPSPSLSKENGLPPAKHSADNDRVKPIPVPNRINSGRSRGPNNPPASGSSRPPSECPNKRLTVPKPTRKPNCPFDEVRERNGREKPSRPKPRPPEARPTSNQPQLQPISSNPSLSNLNLDAGATRIRKKAARQPDAFPADRLSPLSQRNTKKPDEFPDVSPQSSPAGQKTGFPTLSPLGSRTTTPVKAKGTNSNGGGGFPMLSPLSSQPADDNGRSKPKTKHLRPDASSLFSKDEGDDPFKTREGPAPFPMSSQLLGSIGSSPTPPQAGPSRPGKRSSEGKESEDERERKKMREEDVVLAPLDSYDFDEEDSMFISPSTDPRTLCPYCDSSLPSFPTPLLTRLLSATAKKSYRDPRPANPLGRKAPLAVFIGVCQRHRFESETLPEAERKGWPKVIEWTPLGERVQKMKKELQALIDDPGDEIESGDECEVEDDGDGEQGPRSKCVFWKEVIKEVKKKGSRAVAGVRGQFANFEKTQPGYYGELGSVIIHQTLYNLFPPASFNSRTIAPLTSNEFIQRILVPEVGVRLIMEDKHLAGNTGMQTAVKILRESASYGVAMFPEDGGEWGDGGSAGGEGGKGRGRGEDEEMSVADLIVMERAKKRRKELEEEERQEEEMWEREQSDKEKRQIEEKSMAAKGKGGRKGKGKAKEGSISEMELPKSRPRPKPITKSKSVLTSDTDAEIQTSRRKGKAKKKDLDVDGVSEMLVTDTKSRSKRPRRSPSASDSKVEAGSVDKARRTSAGKRKSPRTETEVDVDLCSSSDAVESSDSTKEWKESRPPRRKGRVLTHQNRGKTEETSDDDDSGMAVIQPPITPVVRRDRHDKARRVELQENEDGEQTPRPTRKDNVNPWESSVGSSAAGTSKSGFLPLVAAREKIRNREREQRSRAAEDRGPWMKSMAASLDVSDEEERYITPKSNSSVLGSTRQETNEDAWLLSDNSSVES